MMDKIDKCKSAEKESSKGKTAYSKPNLKKYGSLKELTKFGGSSAADFFGRRT